MCYVPLFVFASLHSPCSFSSCHHVRHLGSLFTPFSLINAFIFCQIPNNRQNVLKSPKFVFISIAFHFLADKHRAHRGRQSIWVIMDLKHLKAFGHPGISQCKGPREQEGIMFHFLETGKSHMCLLDCLEVCVFRSMFYTHG